MSVLPRMPLYQLEAGSAELERTRRTLADTGLGVDLVYPFTLSSRSQAGDFAPALEVAASIGARFANLLVYERDSMRRVDQAAAFGALSRSFGIQALVEFFPASRVRTLEEAASLCREAEGVGLNIDLLHLVRSGGRVEDLETIDPRLIRYAQFADGPVDCLPDQRDFEAASQRMLAGHGALDLEGFARRLPAHASLSVEIPRDDAISAGVSDIERARQALDGVQAIIGRH